jgi:hypothetical protein
VAAWCLVGCGGGSSTPSSPAARDKDGDGFTEAQGDCPRGSDQRDDVDDAIQISLVNDSCSTLYVTQATVPVEVQEAHGTFNHAGQTWTTEHAAFSPTSAGPDNDVSIRVDPVITCTNSRGGGSYNVYMAKVTLQTSAGVLESWTTNTRTDTFPFRGETGAAGQAGSRPR